MFECDYINNSKPYKKFYMIYENALLHNQTSVEVVAISSFDKIHKEVESRYVNLKYIFDEEWIFFSNYNSNKARNFKEHDQISALFYWEKINTQIRIKAKISKSSDKISDKHFKKRSFSKNVLSISSMQSEIIDSYDNVVNNYNIMLEKLKDKKYLHKRPQYWGGYSFVPYYFEFWEGDDNRLNKREIFSKKNTSWQRKILQP